ncbi:MAG: threonine/serine dehydratase [Robiginitomaculum sp.]|nr:threonine/serine dehydratase [Robiginitomaculum sp.]
MALKVPTYTDVVAAARRLKGHARVTPLVRHGLLDKISGLNLFLKDETQQKSGAFKYRGAYSRLSLLNAAERKAGVVAYSSGNHAQGVALAAKELGISVVIIMPNTAPLNKKRGTLSHGAKIVEYDPATTDRVKLAEQIAQTENRILVPPFDEKYIIAGQGTCAVEIIEQCARQGIKLDALITPIGGGGLCAGTNLAAHALSPNTKVYGGEPVDYDDHARSLRSGKRETNAPAPLSLCDALMAPAPGKITFQINEKYLRGVFAVTDDECLLAMALAKQTLDITLEPGGAIALAAALSRPKALKPGTNVAVILSGGNVDEEITRLAEALDC